MLASVFFGIPLSNPKIIDSLFQCNCLRLNVGYLSWIQRSVDGGKAFGWWLLACVGVKMAEWLVVFEESLCGAGSQAPLWIQRYFHSTIIHAEIALLFIAVAQCAFGVIENNRPLMGNNLSSTKRSNAQTKCLF